MRPSRLSSAAILILLAGSARGSHVPIDVALTMSGPAFAAAGSEITYTLRLDAVLSGAAYAVTDTLPSGVVFLQAGGTHWNCLESKGKVTCGNEQLDSTSSVILVTVRAPLAPQTITNTATVVSVSVADNFPDNNTDSVTTTIYDPLACGSSITALSPDENASVAGPQVMLRWSTVSSASLYDVYTAENSSVLTLLISTSDTQLVHDFSPGQVQWYVQAFSPGCPPVATPPRSFSVFYSGPVRHRATQH